MTAPLFTGASWDFHLIQKIYDACEEIGSDELGLDCYPNQLEIITAEQMIDVYACSLPVTYQSWSRGKNFAREEFNYRKGNSGLAYECVFNSSPCINYLMEENSATMQALVIAHAAMGHNSFFKGNYLFRDWTDAAGILDYLCFARDYVAECEARHGAAAVESVLDSCHALQNFGVDKYRRPGKLSKELEEQRKKEKLANEKREVNALWDHLIPKVDKPEEDAAKMEPQENLLYFIEKNAPNLKQWQRELIRITRKIAQYFYPQRQTQVMNEGWASTCHYYIMTRLMEKGLITSGSYLEFLHSHTSVVRQQPMTRQFNPYWLGFNMFAEIKRICVAPTAEDKKYFPDLAGADWLKSWHYAMKNFKDESFISQYLSPAMVRREKLFMMSDDSDAPDYTISRIQNERGFEEIRSALSDRYKLSHFFADIQITDVKFSTTRKMYLEHRAYDGIKLETKTAWETLLHLKNLWGYDIVLESTDTESGLTFGVYDTERGQ